MSVDGFDGSQNLRIISLKFLLFCCFDFDLKISGKYIHPLYDLFHFYLNYHMVQDFTKLEFDLVLKCYCLVIEVEGNENVEDEFLRNIFINSFISHK